jgi:hypothetical protein
MRDDDFREEKFKEPFVCSKDNGKGFSSHIQITFEI